MIPQLKEFIEKNIDLIENNDFTELYNRCRDTARGNLTDVLYECGIDPLQYMTEIPVYFAYKSSITDITIPDSVTCIGDDAFFSCRELVSINIGNGVKSIGNNAFYGCRELTSIIIGNSVMSINDFAFCGCQGLTSVVIPDSVTNIGERAFSDCGNIQITYSGTKQQWKQLVTGWNIFPKTTYVCNCLDGVIKKSR